MRPQYPRRGPRYGAVLVTATLLSVCGGGTDPLPAQSEHLDKNRQAFPAAPAAGTGLAGSSGVRLPSECPPITTTATLSE